MKMIIKSCLILGLLLGLSAICFAEIKTPKNGLFTIDIPQGWSWDDSQGTAIKIADPDKRINIQIGVGGPPIPKGISQDKAKDILKKINEGIIHAVKTGIKPEMGILEIADETEITLGGVYARRLDYSLKKDEHITIANITDLIYKDKFFNIIATYSKTDDNSDIEIDQVLQTLEFHN